MEMRASVRHYGGGGGERDERGEGGREENLNVLINVKDFLFQLI